MLNYNYKKYEVGDLIAFSFGHSVKEGHIETMNEDAFSVILTKDCGAWKKGERFIFKWTDYNYRESVVLSKAAKSF